MVGVTFSHQSKLKKIKQNEKKIQNKTVFLSKHALSKSHEHLRGNVCISIARLQIDFFYKKKA